mgnify:CR=1 FL=1|tara:strand:+ start:202 stop:339 length:138 start_codon:yes stop_codon:yes gene_type:complete
MYGSSNPAKPMLTAKQKKLPKALQEAIKAKKAKAKAKPPQKKKKK